MRLSSISARRCRHCWTAKGVGKIPCLNGTMVMNSHEIVFTTFYRIDLHWESVLDGPALIQEPKGSIPPGNVQCLHEYTDFKQLM